MQDKKNKFFAPELCINAIVLLIFFEAKTSYGFIELQVPLTKGLALIHKWVSSDGIPCVVFLS
jgi:hypothetical protein